MTAPANTAEKAKHTPGMRCAVALQALGIAVTQDTQTLADYIDEMTGSRDMLAALIALRDAGPNGSTGFEGWHPAYSDATRMCREAIAKATGATP